MKSAEQYTVESRTAIASGQQPDDMHRCAFVLGTTNSNLISHVVRAVAGRHQSLERATYMFCMRVCVFKIEQDV